MIESSSSSGTQAFCDISKKIKQVFAKILAANLVVFSFVPAVQNFSPQVEATKVSKKKPLAFKIPKTLYSLLMLNFLRQMVMD